MTESGDLEPRVSALENDMENVRQRVAHTERDAEAARVLAGGADRDGAELLKELRESRKANLRLHNATRADLADIQRRLAGHDKQFVALDKRFDQVDKRFEQVDKRFEQVDKRFAGLEFRMTALEQAVGVGFAEMRGKFDAAAAGQAQIVALLDRLLESGD